jgi:hypothetical protein
MQLLLAQEDARGPNDPAISAVDAGGVMIILGIVLLVIGLVVKIYILVTIGIIILVIGAVLALLGVAGREIGGRRHWY